MEILSEKQKKEIAEIKEFNLLLEPNKGGKITPKFKEVYCQILKKYPNYTVAAKMLGLSSAVNVLRARRNDQDFDDAVKSAIEEGYDFIEEEARRRAVDGVLEPVFYRGAKIGTVRKYSDQLLIALLKGYKPKRFNPGVKITTGSGEKVTMTFNLGGE